MDAALVVVVVSKPACVLKSPSSAAEEGENMPLEWSEFDDKDGDTRVGVDIGATESIDLAQVHACSLRESLTVKFPTKCPASKKR